MVEEATVLTSGPIHKLRHRFFLVSSTLTTDPSTNQIRASYLRVNATEWNLTLHDINPLHPRDYFMYRQVEH